MKAEKMYHIEFTEDEFETLQILLTSLDIPDLINLNNKYPDVNVDETDQLCDMFREKVHKLYE